MNGGYLMVSKSDTNLYNKLNNALTVGKPILWYEDANTCYYIDTITKDGTDIVLTKGGKTITVESDGDVNEVGDIIQKNQYYYIFDAADGTIDGTGTLTPNTYMMFKCNIYNLHHLNKEDIKSFDCIALNSQYADASNNVLNIFKFNIRYDSDNDKVVVSVRFDGSDNNDLDLIFDDIPFDILNMN